MGELGFHEEWWDYESEECGGFREKSSKEPMW
jgi:hypothetical protein